MKTKLRLLNLLVVVSMVIAVLGIPANVQAATAPTDATASAAPQQQPSSNGFIVSDPVLPADTTGMSPVPSEAPYRGAPVEMPSLTMPKSERATGPFTPDSAVQSAPGAGNMPSPLTSWDGILNTGVQPPDTNGQVGPNHYIQIVNTSGQGSQIRIWDKSGNQLYDFGMNGMWPTGDRCNTYGYGDPVVVYDQMADRWILTQFIYPPSAPYSECFAVSKTGTPTNNPNDWWLYNFVVSSVNFPDYPKIGVWPDGYYMMAHQFANASTWAGTGAWVFDRAKMLNGEAATFQYKDLYTMNPDYGGILPSNLMGNTLPPAGSPNYFAEVDQTLGAQNYLMTIFAFHVDWTTPANTSFTVATQFNVDPFNMTLCSASRQQCIDQPGRPLSLEAIPDRLMMHLWYRNIDGHESLVTNHTVNADNAGHAGIRWYELRKTTPTPTAWSLYQQGTYFPTSDHRWMGSIAMDHVGNMALGYSVSSLTTYPSIRYAGRLASDPLGTLPQAEASLVEGGGSFSGFRWGDYSAMSVDPVDDCTFWYTQEYVRPGETSWSTRVGSFKFPNCSIGPQGVLAGTVTSSAGGAPIANASIQATATITQAGGTQSNPDGSYAVNLLTGVYTVTTSAYGFVPKTNTGVSITENATTTLDVALDPAPSYVVSGTVHDALAGWPLYAKITIGGYPGPAIWTDPATGFYSVTLVADATYTFNTTAFVAGYQPGSLSVGPLTSNTTANIGLNADPTTCNAPGYSTSIDGLYENFDSVTPPALPVGWAKVVVTTTSTLADWTTYAGTRYPSGQPAHSAPNLAMFNSFSSGANGSARLYRTSDFDLGTVPTATLSLWMYHDTGYSAYPDRLQVQVSTDGGTTWQNVGDPIVRYDGSTGWKQHTVSLAAYEKEVIRLGLLGISEYGNDVHVDDILIGSVYCLPKPGGLIVGNVNDANTSSGLNGATVSNQGGYSTATVATPADAQVGDGFYTLFSPSGTQVVTATKSQYGPSVASVTVPLSGTVRQDFVLNTGRLVYAPPVIDVTFGSGMSATLPITVSNIGVTAASFQIAEIDGGGTPFGPAGGKVRTGRLSPVPPAGALLHNGGKVDTAVRRPYTFIGNAPRATNILVYADDDQHTPTAVERALQSLGLSYTFYGYDATGANLSAFVTALNAGGWDLVIYAADSWSLNDLSDYTAVQNHIAAGGQAIVHSWAVGYDAARQNHPLWGVLGGSYAATISSPSSLYWWDPTHPILDGVPQFTSLTNLGYLAYGARMNLTGAASTGLGGFTASAGAGQAGVILRADNKTIYKGLTDNLNSADLNSNGVLDSAEWWDNAISYLLNPSVDVPWISTAPVTATVAPSGAQVVNVTVDSAAVVPGIYRAALKFNNDTPYQLPSLPVTMTVTVPPTWGKLTGNVATLGYCDASPTALQNVTVTIQSASNTWNVTTDNNGDYSQWIDVSNNPLTVTVAPAGYASGQAAGVSVIAQGATTQDFTLRWLQPCVSTSPQAYTVTLSLGQTTSRNLRLNNNGGATAVYSLTEQNVSAPASSATTPTGSVDRLGGYHVANGPQPYALAADLIQDGSFEATSPTTYQNPYWTQGSVTYGTVLCDAAGCGTGGGTAGPRTGSFWAWFGGSATGDTGHIEQTVLMGGPSTLSFYLWIGASSGGASDYMKVSLDGTEVWRATGAQIGLYGSYTKVSVPLSAGSGSHVIRFDSVTVGSGNFNLDDVSLESGGGAGSDVPWLTELPVSGTIASDTFLYTTIGFDANAVAVPGTYKANVVVNSNDPVNPARAANMTLNVTAPASWGVLTGTVNSLGYCDVNSVPLAGATVVLQAANGLTRTITTDANGGYTLWLNSSTNPYTLTATAAKHLGSTPLGGLTVSQLGAVTVAPPVDLRSIQSCVDYTPDSLSVTVPWKGGASQTLTLTNSGAASSPFTITEQAGGFNPLAPQALTFLIVGSAGTNVTAVQTALTAAGHSYVLTTTTAFNGLSVATLSGYAGVIWTTSLAPTSTSLPNMQAYLDAGGKLLVFYNDFGYSWRLTAAPNFFTTYLEGQYFSDAGSLGALTGVDIMAGVNPNVSTDPYPDSFTLVGPDAVGLFVAPDTHWASWRVSRNGYKAIIAGFNLNYATPASTQTSIVQNAVAWLTTAGPVDVVPWLSETPDAGTLAANTGLQGVTVGFNANVAAVTQPGTYYASLNLKTDDAGLSSVSIPVTMTVVPSNTQGKLNGTVTGLGYCDINPAPLNNADVLIQGTGVSLTVKTNASGYYQQWLDQANGPYSIAVSTAGYQSVSTTGITVTGSQTTTVNANLRWLKPCISVTPSSLSAELMMGLSTTLPFTVTNSGAVSTTFSLSSDVLVVNDGGGNGTAVSAFTTALTNLGYTYDVVSSSSATGIPANLLNYKYVIYAGVADTGAEANQLTSYLDNGGSLLIADNDFGYYMDGTPLYSTYLEAAYDADSGSDGVITGTNIMAGVVTDISSDPYPDSFTISGANAFGIFLNKTPGTWAGSAIARNTYHAIYLAWDYYYAGGGAVGDPVETTILQKALAWLPPVPAARWLTTSPSGGTLAADTGAQSIGATFDAGFSSITQPGVYTDTIVVKSNDPVKPTVVVPVTMTVDPLPTMGLLTGTVNGLAACDVNPAPLANAALLVESATMSWTLTTNASGMYQVWADAAQAPLTVTVSKSGFVGQSVAGVPLTAMQTTTRNFDLRLLAPCASSAPSNLSTTLTPNHQQTQTLTISNTGTVPLTWEIKEELTQLAPAVPLSGDATLPAPAVSSPASETVGNALEVVKGPQPSLIGLASQPFVPADVLFDNGPLVTNAGAGAGGADASALQTALGLGTYGAGHALSSGFRVADDFVVTGGDWQINTITFFAYQTGSGTTSTINHVNVRIWDGVPGAAGSSIVWGDTTTNRLSNTIWSNIYRVLDTGLTDTARPIMADTASVGISLPPGTYWLDWQTGGTGASGPWAPPISILGQTTTGNAMQYDPTTSTWGALTDGGTFTPQGLPFIIEGSAGCATDIPWVSTTPMSGTTAVNSSSAVSVVFDSTGLTSGVHTGNLCVKTNDATHSKVLVPVSLTVPTPTLTLHTVGNGTVVAEPVGTHDYGDVITLTATADTGWSFTGWSGDMTGSVNPITFTMEGDMVVTATFTIDTFTITPTSGANGSITPNTPQTVNYGGSQMFAIAANMGYHIADVGVDGASIGVVSAYTFTNVMANHTITATFAPDPVNLTVNVVGNGSVAKDPDQAYHYGDVVTLTANADLNWAFSGWSGDLSGTTNPTAITLNGDKVVTATFASTCVPVNGADFTYLPTAPKVSKIVTFDGTAMGTTPITYTWDFGDGSAAGSGTPITHLFPITLTTHSYTVTMTAANACGSVPVLKSLTVQPQTIFLPIVKK
jgi:hypothetical protein